jgi:hypothetical protein
MLYITDCHPNGVGNLLEFLFQKKKHTHARTHIHIHTHTALCRSKLYFGIITFVLTIIGNAYMNSFKCQLFTVREQCWVTSCTSELPEKCTLSVLNDRWLLYVICRYFASYWPVHLVKRSFWFTEFNILHFVR